MSAKDAHVNNFVEANEACVQFIKQIFIVFMDPIPSNKKVRLYIDHEAFSNPINTPFMDKDELTVEMMLSYFYLIVQFLKLNEDEFEINFNYKVKLSVITQGRKRKVRKTVSIRLLNI